MKVLRAAAGVAAQEYEMVLAGSLVIHPENPRKGDLEKIQESIEANRFYGAVVAQKSTGRVLAGNHRLLAALKCGLEKVPCIWVDVDDATARRIMLADNRTGDVAGYDDAKLAELLRSAREAQGDTAGTGYSEADLELLLDKLHGEAASSSDASVDGPSAGYVIQYNIVFENEQQQRVWYDFLVKLKGRYPDQETTAARLVRHIQEATP